MELPGEFSSRATAFTDDKAVSAEKDITPLTPFSLHIFMTSSIFW